MGDLLQHAFTPYRLNGIELKNRFVKTATYEGMTPGGIPNDKLIRFHSRIAEGGVGLTTVAYGAVSEDGRTHEDQLLINEKSRSMLERLVESVHGHGRHASIQLTHCGFFTSSKNGGAPKSASKTVNLYGLMSGKGIARAMSRDDMDRVLMSFVRAAVSVKEMGFDAIEIHMGHGYLLSQFLSPLINKRNDEYGGSIENRIRFPVEVLSAIRHAVGSDLPLICKVNVSDGIKGGFTPQDAVALSETLGKSGADAIELSGGFTSRNAFYLLRGAVPRSKMAAVQKDWSRKLGMKLFGRFLMKAFPFEENFFMPLSQQVKSAVGVPMVYLGGVTSAVGVQDAMEKGFELVAIGRALIHDPDFIKKLESGYVSPCNHCNECLVEMDKQGVRCVL